MRGEEGAASGRDGAGLPAAGGLRGGGPGGGGRAAGGALAAVRPLTSGGGMGLRWQNRELAELGVWLCGGRGGAEGEGGAGPAGAAAGGLLHAVRSGRGG